MEELVRDSTASDGSITRDIISSSLNATTTQQDNSGDKLVLLYVNDSSLSSTAVINSSSSNHATIEDISAQVLERLSEHYGVSEFHLIVGQLLIGLTLNIVIFCSIMVSYRQIRDNSVIVHRANYYRSAKYSQIPVIDLILALMSSSAILRLLARSALQIVCFYGACFTSDSLCYMQGFVNTFLHYLNLWTMALFVQDRYIAHYKQHDYICKCSHFVLYVTLICVAFLTAMHICAPIYGFSSYRYLIDEITCSIDWLSRYSCPYFIYSILFVSGPAYIPILYWTFRLTYRRLIELLSFLRTSRAKPSPDDDDVTALPHTIVHHYPYRVIHYTPEVSKVPQTRTKISFSSYLQSKPFHILFPCCFVGSHRATSSTLNNSVTSLATQQTQVGRNSFEMQATTTTTETSPNNVDSTQNTISTQLDPTNNNNSIQRDSLSSNSSNTSATNRKNRKRSSATSSSNGNSSNVVRKSVTYQQRSSTASTGSDRTAYMSGPSMYSVSSSISHLTKSHVLTHSKEIKSVTICSWIFVLSYTPRLLNSLCKSCFHPSRIVYDPNAALNPKYVAPPPEPLLIERNRLTSFDIRTTFYLTYLDESAICVLIPLVLLLFHSKLRFSLIMCIACCLSACRLPFRQVKLTRMMSSRHSFRNSRKNKKAHRAATISSSSNRHRQTSLASTSSSFRLPSSVAINRSKKSANNNNSHPKCLKISTSTDHNVMASICSNGKLNSTESATTTTATSTTLNRSSSLRINYPSSHHGAGNHLHYTQQKHQSDRNIAVTII